MTSQDTSVSHNRPQDQSCPLCKMWAMMPYAKRWSTPTSVIDTESALVIGYWLGTRYKGVKLCERHDNLIFDLNRKETPLLLSNALEPPISSYPSEFKLGSRPLANENTITPAPPLSIEATLPHVQPNASTNTQLTIDPVKLALEAALMPPTEGAKNTYTCPICNNETTMGGLHVCRGS